MSPFGHRAVTEGTIPAGRAVVHQDGTADLEFLLDTTPGRETFATVKWLGSIVEHSYAYQVIEEGKLTPEMRAAGVRRYLKRVEVLEVSPVVRGAGIGTGTLAVKQCGCGAGSACGCEGKTKARCAEMEAIAAESRRILAFADRVLQQPVRSPEAVQKSIVAANWKCGFTPETRVDRERHQLACEIAQWAAAQWGVRPLRVKWYNYRNVPDPRTRRFFDKNDPGSIWLRSSLYGKDLLTVVCHEASHAARHARGLSQDETQVERDTYHLARRYLQEIAR